MGDALRDWFDQVFAPQVPIPEVKLFVDGKHTYTLKNVTGPTFAPVLCIVHETAYKDLVTGVGRLGLLERASRCVNCINRQAGIT